MGVVWLYAVLTYRSYVGPQIAWMSIINQVRVELGEGVGGVCPCVGWVGGECRVFVGCVCVCVCVCV